MNAQYIPKEAQLMEDILRALWKPAPNAGKTPHNNFAGVCAPDRIVEGNRKKQAAYDLIGDEWVTPGEIAAQLPYRDDAVRGRIAAMTTEGLLERKKERNRIYVRRPQGDAA